MALLGLSLIVASFVYVLFRPPPWLLQQWPGFRRFLAAGGATTTESARLLQDEKGPRRGEAETSQDVTARIREESKKTTQVATTTGAAGRLADSISMPPPPSPPPSLIIQPPVVLQEPGSDPESPTTPKATAAPSPRPVPSFSLAADDDDDNSTGAVPPSAPASMMMPPPPPPKLSPLSPGRVPSLGQFPAPNSAQRARGPAPNRGGGGPVSSSASGGLAPPPTLSSKPAKPSRQVMLTPGHSPLDWARISGPNADLRGLPASTPYLRVTPSMLKVQSGRKGKDAWMALNGRVYNVTPYAKFHPGGVPELMRGAAKDGTKLFGEIHPWVNYETMLAACLVGLLVDEPEPGQESEMDKMD